MKVSGMALIELIIVILLVGLFGLLAISVYFGNFKLFRTQDTEIEISSQNRITLDEVLSRIREAVNVESSYFDGSTTYTSNNDSIVLKLTAIDNNNQIVENEFDRVIYYLVNNKLTKLVFPSSSSARMQDNKPLSNIVTNLNFTYDNTDFNNVTFVTVSITTAKNVLGQTKDITVSGQARLRNY